MTEEYPAQPVCSLRWNAFWGVLAQAGYAGGRFLIFALPAKFLPADQMGGFAWALSVITPLAYLVHLQLRLVLVTDVSSPIPLGHYVTLRGLGNLVMLAGVGLISVLYIQSWQTAIGPLLLAVGLVRILESWSDLCLGVLQKRERMAQVAFSQAAKLSIIIIWILGDWLWVKYGWGRHILWIVLGWIVAIALVLGAYDIRQARRWEDFKPQWNAGMMISLVRSAWPLGVFLALTGLNDTIVRYFVGRYLDLASVAYLAGMTFIITGLVVVQNGVNQALLPRLARYYMENPPECRRLCLKVLMQAGWLGILFLVVMVYMGNPILARLYRPEYALNRVTLGLIALAGGVLLIAMVLGDTLVACRRFKARMMAVAAGLFVNFLICWWGFPSAGLNTAAWALLASAVVNAAVCGWVLYQVLSPGQSAQREPQDTSQVPPNR